MAVPLWPELARAGASIASPLITLMPSCSRAGSCIDEGTIAPYPLPWSSFPRAGKVFLPTAGRRQEPVTEHRHRVITEPPGKRVWVGPSRLPDRDRGGCRVLGPARGAPLGPRNDRFGLFGTVDDGRRTSVEAWHGWEKAEGVGTTRSPRKAAAPDATRWPSRSATSSKRPWTRSSS